MFKTCRAITLLVLFGALAALLPGQPRVDPRNRYERIVMIVAVVGTGSMEDPKRPQYTPLPATLKTSAVTRNGIIAFTQVLSDDGKFALVEFVARDRSAFQSMLADKSVKSFVKGKDKPEDIVTEFKKYKKDFDITTFGVRMP